MADDGSASDGLTYSDRLILRAIAAGKRDPEIAVMLGVSVTHVRSRIERMARLSGIDTRGGLAEWDGELTAPQPAAVPEPATVEDSRRRPWLAIGLTAVAVIVAAGALAGFLVHDRDGAPLTSAPAVQHTPDHAAPSLPPATPLRFLAAQPFPDDVLLFILRGCEGCAAPIALDRVYRDTGGVLHSDVIFRPATAAGAYLLGAWARRDGSDIVVAVCEQGSCGLRRPPSPDAATRFYRSRDGGATWADVGRVDGVGETVSTSTGNLVLVRVARSDALDYAVLGGDGSEDASFLLPQGPPAEFTLIGKLDAETVQGLSRIAINASGVFAYTWYPQSPAPDTDGVSTRLGIADRWGEPMLALEYVGAPLLLGAWLDGRTVTATVTLPNGAVAGGDAAQARRLHVPVLIDVARGTVMALPEPFTNTRYAAATSEVIAAQRGRFTSVGPHPDGCVPLLAAPRYDARPIACLAEGALVEVVESRLVVSEEWLGIRVISGRSGWVRPADVEAVISPAR